MSYFSLSKLQLITLFLTSLILGFTGCSTSPEAGIVTTASTKSAVVDATPEVGVAQIKTVNPTFTPNSLPSITPANTVEQYTQNEEETEFTDQEFSTITPISPSITPTTTPAPTLSPQQEGEFLSSIMQRNGSCELPCWWGIVPGQTGEQEARDLFASQGIDKWTSSEDYRIVGIGYPREENSEYFRDIIVRFWIENNLVQYIGIEGSYRRELNSLLVQDWQSYSVPEILKRYGTPSYIELVKVENSPYYRLALSYESLGIELSYVVPFQFLENGKSELCFNLQNVDFIGLSLFFPEKAKDIPVGIIPNRLDSFTSWETTTGLSKEDFWQLMENYENQRCIVVD